MKKLDSLERAQLESKSKEKQKINFTIEYIEKMLILNGFSKSQDFKNVFYTKDKNSIQVRAEIQSSSFSNSYVVIRINSFSSRFESTKKRLYVSESLDDFDNWLERAVRKIESANKDIEKEIESKKLEEKERQSKYEFFEPEAKKICDKYSLCFVSIIQVFDEKFFSFNAKTTSGLVITVYAEEGKPSYTNTKPFGRLTLNEFQALSQMLDSMRV